MVTIYDVAKLAGVSPATVSRVFNGGTVSEPKAAAVRAAAAELEFTPNRAARALRTQTTAVIALVIPDIENPYFTEVARGVEDVAQDAGYSIVLCNSDGLRDKEAVYLGVAAAERMAGVLIAAASRETDVTAVTAAGGAVVAIDRLVRADVDAVTIANRDAGFSATESLIHTGFRRIACVTGPADIDTARERARGWREALEAAELPASDELLRYSTFRVDGGREAVRELLSLPDPPDAIVAGNNLLGIGTLQEFVAAGRTPPETGVAVVGSLPYATHVPAAVSVVQLPAREMGETAARMLLERIAGDARRPRTVVLRGELVPAEV